MQFLIFKHTPELEKNTAEKVAENAKMGDNPSVTGKSSFIRLRACLSYQSVIEQFKEMYPNIDIEVIYSVNK